MDEDVRSLVSVPGRAAELVDRLERELAMGTVSADGPAEPAVPDLQPVAEGSEEPPD